jgi:3-phosphoglycerate kinase
MLAELRNVPQKPYVALIAGPLLSEKVSLLYALLEKADKLLIAGDMADTFYRAQGHQIGTAATEPDMIPLAQDILEAAEQHGVAVHLATDARILPSEVAAARLSELVHSVSDTSEDSGSQHTPPRSTGTPLNLDYAHKVIQLGVKRVPLSLSATPAGPLFKPVADSTRIVPVVSIPSGWMAVDAGPDTVATFCGALTGAATVLWTGEFVSCV